MGGCGGEGHGWIMPPGVTVRAAASARQLRWLHPSAVVAGGGALLLPAERLPPEYAARRQAILCNDCGETGQAAFHFVYHRCQLCSSYNTRVV